MQEFLLGEKILLHSHCVSDQQDKNILVKNTQHRQSLPRLFEAREI